MLDNFQMDVVKSNDNLLVIAGPGSGKTTTILSKINYLIEKGYKDDILVLSFTNKSVNDIKERLNEDVFVTTFHKLAIDILNYQNIPYKIIDSSLLDYIIYEYFKRFSKSEINKLCIYLNISSLRFALSAILTSILLSLSLDKSALLILFASNVPFSVKAFLQILQIKGFILSPFFIYRAPIPLTAWILLIFLMINLLLLI